MGVSSSSPPPERSEGLDPSTHRAMSLTDHQIPHSASVAVWDSRRQRSDEVFDAFGRFPGGRRIPQERFERHPDHVRRPAAEAAGRPPKRTPQRCGQTDRDLIVHEDLRLCTAIVVQRPFCCASCSGNNPGIHRAASTPMTFGVFVPPTPKRCS